MGRKIEREMEGWTVSDGEVLGAGRDGLKVKQDLSRVWEP